jgi:LuxR family transcriptional regulator
MNNTAIELELKSLKKLAPAGYSIGISIRFYAPLKVYYDYPKAWIEEYTENGYALVDPAVIWGITNEGIIEWDKNKLADEKEIFKKAAKHGMKYGITCSIKIDKKKTIASFARTDRRFTETEKELIRDSLERLHIAHMPNENLTTEELDTLDLTSKGFTGEQIAKKLNIALATVKSRLTTARRKLGAKNTNEAASLAKSLGLFEE